jgi:protein-S-isoprenylcysteine O-methyltransferase Ste14
LLPGIVLALVPGLLLLRDATELYGPWSVGPAVAVALFGVAALIGGAALMAFSITLFAAVGKGTLAPWDPPRRFVVAGPYRYVRNPMISGVTTVLLGEALVLNCRPLGWWFAAFLVGNLLFIHFIEEPALRRRFGESYAEYCRNVPAWIPRLRPWTPPAAQPPAEQPAAEPPPEG